MKEFEFDWDRTASRAFGLTPDCCSWLDELGLEETRWILDTEYLLTNTNWTYKEFVINGQINVEN